MSAAPKRIGVFIAEGVAIIASILLAFAIDAWWEGRNEKTAARGTVGRLLAEYQQNRDALEAVRERHLEVTTVIDEIMPLFSPTQDSIADELTVAAHLIATLSNPVFSPQLGSTRSLLTSGELRYIDDAVLLAMLNDWEATAQQLIDWQEIERTHGEELIVPLTYKYVAWPDYDYALNSYGTPSQFASDFNAFFRDRQLEGLFFNRRWNSRQSIERIDELLVQTDALIARLQLLLNDH